MHFHRYLCRTRRTNYPVSNGRSLAQHTKIPTMGIAFLIYLLFSTVAEWNKTRPTNKIAQEGNVRALGQQEISTRFKFN